MTTVAALVERACRSTGILAEMQTVTAYQSEVAIDAFNEIIDTLPSRGVGDVMTTQRVTSDCTVAAPSVLHVMATAALTITLPKEPRDGFRVKIVDVAANFATYNATVARNGWLIAGSASDVTLSTNGQSKEYMFRADLGDWADITRPLAASSAVPFPAEFDGPLSAILGVRMLEVFPREAGQSVYQRADDGLNLLQARYLPDMTASFDRDLIYTPSRLNDRWQGGET